MTEIKKMANPLFQEMKLRPCEMSLYRKTFLARIENGASVEAAHKQALHACKLWENVGAFNDDRVETEEVVYPADTKFRDGFDALCDYFADEGALAKENVDSIAVAYRIGRLSLGEFRKKLGLDRDVG